jgi:hypothetical protein
MTDVMTNKPLQVLPGGATGPYLYVPVSQLDEVRQLLDSHEIRYRVDNYSVSLNESPFVIVVAFGRGADPNAVQNILDSIR